MYGPSFNNPIVSGSMAEYRVPASTNSVLILSASLHRRSATIFNAGNGNLHLRYAPTVDLSASFGMYHVKLTSGSYYEVPIAYQGRINGIWDNSAGFAFVVDFSDDE